MTWLVPYGDLTPDQLRAVEATADQHRLIAGAPGSGKTLALVHRVAHLRQRHGVAEGRYRVIIFTGVVKQYIAAACTDLGIPPEAVSTYDAWCAEYFGARIGGRRPWDSQRQTFDFARIRGRVRAEVLARRPAM